MGRAFNVSFTSINIVFDEKCPVKVEDKAHPKTERDEGRIDGN